MPWAYSASATLSRCLQEVRLHPNSDRLADIALGRFGAKADIDGRNRKPKEAAT
jgi:hypothetical protein